MLPPGAAIPTRLTLNACSIKRMGKAGKRCFCDGKMVKTNRCK